MMIFAESNSIIWVIS